MEDSPSTNQIFDSSRFSVFNLTVLGASISSAILSVSINTSKSLNQPDAFVLSSDKINIFCFFLFQILAIKKDLRDPLKCFILKLSLLLSNKLIISEVKLKFELISSNCLRYFGFAFILVSIGILLIVNY